MVVVVLANQFSLVETMDGETMNCIGSLGSRWSAESDLPSSGRHHLARGRNPTFEERVPSAGNRRFPNPFLGYESYNLPVM